MVRKHPVVGPPFFLILRLHGGTVQLQQPAPAVFGSDIRGTDIIYDRHDHHHRDGKPRPQNIDEAEEAVLLHQLPGLFEILFVHIYYLS